MDSQTKQPTAFGRTLLGVMNDRGIIDLDELTRLSGLNPETLTSVVYADTPDRGIPPAGFGIALYRALSVTKQERERLEAAWVASLARGFSAADPRVHW